LFEGKVHKNLPPHLAALVLQLHRFRIFCTMNSEENYLDQLPNAQIWSEEITFRRNEFLHSTGGVETHIYLIIEGAVRVFYEAEHEEHTIRLGYKNNMISDLPSYLSGKNSTLNIQAIKKTIVKKAHKNDVEALIAENAQNAEHWIKTLEQLFLQQFEREVDLLTASPEERYKRVLSRSPQLFQEIPHKYIANYLRMTPETLSRLKKS